MSDTPIPGWYRTRLVKNGPWVPVRIYHGLPVVSGEEQDRAPQWCVEVAGKTDYVEKDPDNPEYRCHVLLDVYRYWPWCGREPITEGEYKYMIAHAAWSKQHAPHHPEAQPRKAINKRGASVF